MNENSVVAKIQQINDQTDHYIKQIREAHKLSTKGSHLSFVSYFSHSLSVAEEKGEDHVLLGNYTVKNTGTVPIHSPVLFIRIQSDTEFSFSGKYKQGKSTANIQIPWERLEVEGSNPSSEYWLKPSRETTIGVNEQVVFQNFQLKWTYENRAQLLVEGFTYSQEVKEGIASLNSISVRG
ncbi:hypothetical protein [Falsibacillus albus]|uniref:Uncharacterized protein n=1 Tax=Falsibacillus albus TaxID=2478915 RepID=A0A3L7K4Y1_9BACI|nr:hypothetical protein [Falsibacillus albus]RLQ97131.1 hypothetical protein D9X91_02965 [Falsibacillus albus]